MSNQEWISRFSSHLRFERSAGQNTIESYGNDLRKYARWLDGKPFCVANGPDLERFTADELNHGRSARTVRRVIASLKTFYRFLLDEGEINHNPLRYVAVPKIWKRVPHSVSESELQTMLDSLDTSTEIGIRDRAMLLTFFASGLRESELRNLRLQDLDLQNGAAKVWNGKGGKDGIVPLSPIAVEALRTYLETVRSKHDGNDYVFLSRRGEQITRQQIFYRVRNIASAALGKEISPHALRHGFATALINGGADIRDVQALMRHSDIDTTSVYVHTDVNYLRRIYYASHPRARIL
jgi:integrase/recombinase XerD